MDDKYMLRVGIVGCGLIGNKRAKVIMEDPESELCFSADSDPFCAGALIKEYGEGKGVAYKDWKLMLDKEKIDAVVVATPNKFLKKITLWAAHRGIHVLCEKPLGRNAWESERMVTVAGENGVVLKTGFNHRHHPGIFRAHEMVEKDEVGPIYFIRCVYGHGGRPSYEKEWRTSKDVCGGGELLDQGVHVVDLFRWFMGDFDEASGYIPTYFWDMEVEDNAFALFRTEKGQTASMHTSWTQWKNRFVFEVFGEAGYLIVDGLGGSYGVETLTVGKRPTVNGYSLLEKGSADYADYGDEKVREEKANGLAQRRPSTISRTYGVNKGAPVPSPGATGQAKGGEARITNQQVANNSATRYAGGVPDEETVVFNGPDVSWELEWKEFTAAIRENREPLGNGQDGLEANRMIGAVYRSAEEKRVVRIEGI